MGLWYRMLVIPAIVALAAIFTAIAPAPAAAHDYYGPGTPWCTTEANTPYQPDGSTIFGSGYISCVQTPPVEMELTVCLQWYDNPVDQWFDDACRNWSGVDTHAHMIIPRDCYRGTWRTRVWSRWYLDGHWHYSSLFSGMASLC